MRQEVYTVTVFRHNGEVHVEEDFTNPRAVDRAVKIITGSAWYALGLISFEITSREVEVSFFDKAPGERKHERDIRARSLCGAPPTPPSGPLSCKAISPA